MDFSFEDEDDEIVYREARSFHIEGIEEFSPLARISLPGYRFHKTIGKGQFGKVKLASHILTGEKVAIKIMSKLELDQETLVMINREIRIMKLLRHPNIIRLFDVKETSHHIFLIMEHASGGEIMNYIVAHERLQEKDAKKFFAQIVNAVGYMHSVRCCHRDLKASNMLLDENLNIKIIDFGLSNMYSPGALLKTFCGSPTHASPELIQRIEYEGPEVDIWSLGVILYNFVCGKLPFEGRSFDELFTNILAANYSIPDYVSEDCKNLISRMLHVDITTRATLEEIAAHPWFDSKPCITHYENSRELNEEVLESLVSLGYDRNEVIHAVKNNKYVDAAATYFLMLSKRKRNDSDVAVAPTIKSPVAVLATPIKKTTPTHKRSHTADARIIVDLDAPEAVTPLPKVTTTTKIVTLDEPLNKPKKQGSKTVVISDNLEIISLVEPEITFPTMTAAVKKGHRRSRSVDPRDFNQVLKEESAKPVPKVASIKEMPVTKEELEEEEEEEEEAEEEEWVDLDESESDATAVPTKSPKSKKISKFWKNVKSLLSTNNGVPRAKKAAFSTSTISNKNPAEILLDIKNVLSANRVQYYVNKFTIYCEVNMFDEAIRFELEICSVPRLKNTYFIHANRIAGNEWKYKSVLNDLLPKMNL